MGSTTAGESFRKRLTVTFVVAALLLPVLFAGSASAADLSLSSRSYLLYFERELAGGNKEQFAPLYEYLSADAANLGGTSFSFHFYGWGRVDLSDASGSGKESGDLGSAYLEYLHPQGNAQMKLGRFFFAEGAAVETLDGGFIKMTTPLGIGFSVFGGVPVEHSILDNVKGGDSLYGGRLFFARTGRVEIGASYLKEAGPFQGKDRELYGGDLWLRVASPVELTGQAAYNRSTRELASQRYAARIMPGARVDISGGYESYTYKSLFQTTLNPAFFQPSIDNDDKVRVIFGVVDWEIVPGWVIEIAGKNIRHDNVATGNANRGEIGIRHTYNGGKDAAGISAAAVTADRDENEYREIRGFATWSPGKFRLSLDALAQQYKKEINGKKNASQIVASAGYRFFPSFLLSGDFQWTQSPTFSSDYAGLVRATLDLATGSGGKK
ncbi:MAG: hypothetical protein C4529_08660 [Deltaproteobacteria bacterium]|nr:MAG: hypothetical protein C4529_08660 [Deltaproteobacteria bacterium]